MSAKEVNSVGIVVKPGHAEALNTAAELSASLRPEEMTRIAAWLRSAEGGRFLDAWASLRDPESAARRRRALQSDPARTAPTVFNPARASFRQRTRNLPQPAPR